MLNRTLPLSAILVVLAIGSARGAIFAEVGDAGELPTTAQSTVGTGAIDAITGTLSAYTDRDMFKIYISGTVSFSASTSSTNNLTDDPTLFLFNSNGIGVIANDDKGPPQGSHPDLPPGRASVAV